MNASSASRRIVVLVSGTGTLLNALACDQSSFAITGVIADHPCPGLEVAASHNIPTTIVERGDAETRDEWDHRLAEAIATYTPDLVVSAGFMKILGEAVLRRFPGQVINSHPALLPSFPGMHAVRDALAYGVAVTGCTVHLVDRGVDTGPIVAQEAVLVAQGDTEETLHEKIKTVERVLLTSICNRPGPVLPFSSN